MPILLAAITVIIQACFIFHVFKTGRPYWWAFIILSFPVIGCVVYYFIEIFPGSKEARSANKLANAISKKMAPDSSFMLKMEEVEVCGSVDNKAALALECVERGMYEDAERLYRNCVQGLYANDATLMLGLASVLVEKRDYREAQQTLNALGEKHPGYKANEVRLLQARALEGLGDNEAALREYEALAPVFVGMEARVRRALLLRKLGHLGRAVEDFNNVLTQARRHHITHQAEQYWIDVARKELKS